MQPPQALDFMTGGLQNLGRAREFCCFQRWSPNQRTLARSSTLQRIELDVADSDHRCGILSENLKRNIRLELCTVHPPKTFDKSKVREALAQLFT
jgi:hypothetical protein